MHLLACGLCILGLFGLFFLVAVGVYLFIIIIVRLDSPGQRKRPAGVFNRAQRRQEQAVNKGRWRR